MTRTLNLRQMSVLACLGLLAVVALVYWPGLRGGFIFDDYPNFVENPIYHVRRWDTQAWLTLWNWSRDNIGRPLAMATFALNYMAGGSIFGFKLANVALHLFNTWLAYRLALRIAQLAQPGLPSAYPFALVCAALWALHPLQVSTVLYVVQRMEMLGFTFTLLGLLSYLKARHASSTQGAAAWTALAFLAIGVGYTAKETVVLVPLYIIAMEWLLPGLQPASPMARARRRWAGLALVALGLVAMAVVLPHYLAQTQFPGRRFGPWDRMLTQLPVLATYLRYALLPSPLQYRFYYDDYPVSQHLLSPTATLWGLFAVLAFLALASAVRRRRPLVALGIFWFFMANALTSGPFSLELAFEHRNYPALFGLALAAVDATRWATSALRPAIRPVLAGTVTVVFAALTYMQAAMWGNALLLDQELARLAPTSPRAQYAFATRQFDTYGAELGTRRFDALIHQFEIAADLPLSSPQPDQALLYITAAAGLTAPAQWWERFQRKLLVAPIDPQFIRAVQAVAGAANDGLPIDHAQLHRMYAILIRRDGRNPMWASQYIDLLAGPLQQPAAARQQLAMLLAAHPRDMQLRARLRSHYEANQRPELAKEVR